MNKIERITLAHGSGGEPSLKLIKELFLKEFNNPFLSPLTDSAILTILPSPQSSPARGEEAIGRSPIRIAFTTDSYDFHRFFKKYFVLICGNLRNLRIYNLL
ncbi:MAG: hypothetical protein A2W77_06170 [Nitrospinae bacterium RIFCSPLOWO2_12_39_16]|nr:MAG: hypothetical protein A2W77_06170 [Nitrospinae bacterium RIFCSPLOWO2_12_39_16]